MLEALPLAARLALPTRLLRKIAVDPSDHWLWVGHCDPDGYPQVHWQGRTRLAHRTIWTILRGEIPEGLTLDHLCKVRACVRPEHMRVVPHAVNASRRPQAPEPPEPAREGDQFLLWAPVAAVTTAGGWCR